MAPNISPFVILVASIFTSNMILSNFLGMCSYLSVSTEYKTANGLGMAVTLVLVLTTAINWPVYHYLIVPSDLVYLQYIIFIMVIAASVQILEMGMDRYTPDLHAKLGIFLPLIGLGEVFYKGKRCKTQELFQEKGMRPIELGPKEGLALINGTQFILSFAVKAVFNIVCLVGVRK